MKLPIHQLSLNSRAMRILTAAGAAIATVMTLAGCKVGPNYHQPQTALPGSFRNEAFAGTNAAPDSVSHWWTTFGDSQLESLIGEATRANLDVRLARARVREARALRGVEASALFPQVDAQGRYTRVGLSRSSSDGQTAAAVGRSLVGNYFNAALDMSWEIDVFGGTRRSVEAADADVQAAEESGRDILVSVLAEVGLNYLELRGLQKELAVAKDNLRVQQDTLALTRDRRHAGLASELDTSRSEAQVASTRSQIPPIEQNLQRAIYRLSVLLGQVPAELEPRLAVVKGIPSAPAAVPVGLPSDLVRQRPDIRHAEQELAAATARIGVATADLFPKFYLTGAAGLQSLEASDFFTGGRRFWSLGPSLQWPIFTAGRIRQNIRVHNVRQEAALIRYEKTVLTSLEEVENSLVAFGKEQDRYRALAESEVASRRSVELATERYLGGLVDFLNVLDAQSSLLSIQDQLVRSESVLSQNAVRLYKALGGGWQNSPSDFSVASLSRSGPSVRN